MFVFNYLEDKYSSFVPEANIIRKRSQRTRNMFIPSHGFRACEVNGAMMTQMKPTSRSRVSHWNHKKVWPTPKRDL